MGCELEPIVISGLLDAVLMHPLNTVYLSSKPQFEKKIDTARKVTDWGAISPNKKKKETA
jgi:hypothetical protein